MAPRCTAVCCSLPWPWKGNWGADFGRCGGMEECWEVFGGHFVELAIWVWIWEFLRHGHFLNCEYETLIGSHIFGIIFGTFSWQNCGYVWWLLWFFFCEDVWRLGWLASFTRNRWHLNLSFYLKMWIWRCLVSQANLETPGTGRVAAGDGGLVVSKSSPMCFPIFSQCFFRCLSIVFQ